ncbi:MAG: ATP-binding protein [Prevotellaceae bacterium]|nr:ATP-binding protein [Candidatus Faecinaster equi]
MATIQNMDSESKIKQEIQDLLSQNPIDYGRIVMLSNELARFDNEKVRFSVDAGIISRLGEELVGKRETAVAELIKNAYDADATVVDVLFQNAWMEGGSLIIDDNGVGMTRDQLMDGFMRLSSSVKIHNPVSPTFNRTRAGRKGIGRFAAQRLGNYLTIVTQTHDSDNALKVEISWDAFESDKDLNAIESRIEFIPKQKIQGTLLRIDGLRDGWSDGYVKRIYHNISTLLQPYPLSISFRNDEDPGFKTFFYRDVKDETHKIVDEVSEITQFALAEIETYVDDDGQAHWSLKSNQLDYYRESLIGKNPDEETSKMVYVRGVHARIYYFIYEASLLAGQKRAEIKAIADEQGGVRLYRKGFRVLPYGEKRDDWLGLDQSARRRSIVAPHQNTSFFGLVEIDNKGAEIFEETSSREGLIQNEAYEELVNYLYSVIIAAVLKVADLRGRKGSAGQRDWGKKNTSIRVDAAISELRNIIEQKKKGGEKEPDNAKTTSSFYEQANELIDTIVIAREEEKKERQKLIDENNMLRVLAGTGLVIGEFIHEIKRFGPAFSADLLFLRNRIGGNVELIDKVDEMETSLKSFSSYTAYFDKTISRNVIRELEPTNIKEQVNEFIKNIKNDVDRANIDIPDPVYEGKGLITVPMHPSEWMSILFNLYTNAKKAMKGKDEKRILIRCWKTDGRVFIQFSDTGKGIPDEDRENVFNAFFTTSSPVGRGDDTFSGTGLGLTIIKEIVTSYNGNIMVVSPYQGYNTTFQISIPAN